MNLEVETRNRSNSSLASRSRSRSNSFKPIPEKSIDGLNGDIQLNTTNSMKRASRKNNLMVPKSNDLRSSSNGSISSLMKKPKGTDKETTRQKPDKGEIKSIHDEDSGIFSSLLNIAHKTIGKSVEPETTIESDESEPKEIQSPDGFDVNSRSSTFSKNLDNLIKNDDLDDGISANNIHFESVRESPVNTMGEGNLSLDDFVNMGDDPETVEVSQEVKDQHRKSTVVSDQESGVSIESIKFASERRNKDFHQIFKKIPSDENLIEDFSCALSKDLLIQGRMYLSENFICFKSNILGWVTNLMIPLQEVVQIEKRSTAVLFPNGMIIRTLYQKYIFATFVSRDATFKLLTNVWHRVLLDNDQSIAFENEFDNDTIDTDTDGVAKNSSESTGEDMGDVGSESAADINGIDAFSEGQIGEVEDLTVDSEDGDGESDKSRPKAKTIGDSGGFNGLPMAGPLTHEPTELGYEKSGNDVFIAEDEFKAPVGVIYNLLFGKDNSYYVKILKNQKNIQIEEQNIQGLSNSNKDRNYKYVKPLGAPIGPKQTSCVINDKLLEYDLDKRILVEQTTSTPDVPSGNSFKIRTKIFLHWGENNTTKFYVITQIEWSGKSWIKGPIEKGSIDGQKESMKILIDTVNDILKSEVGRKGKKKRSKSVKRTESELKPSKPIEAPKEEPKPTGIIDKLNDLSITIGENIPIPFISPMIIGYIVIVGQLLVVSWIYNHMFKSQNVVIDQDSITVNNSRFLLIPSIENSLNNRQVVMENEMNFWNWIKDRSGNRLYNDDNYIKGYNQQELKEIIRLTKLKIDRLNRELI